MNSVGGGCSVRGRGKAWDLYRGGVDWYRPLDQVEWMARIYSLNQTMSFGLSWGTG